MCFCPPPSPCLPPKIIMIATLLLPSGGRGRKGGGGYNFITLAPNALKREGGAKGKKRFLLVFFSFFCFIYLWTF